MRQEGGVVAGKRRRCRLALAEVAKVVSERGDYSIRARRVSEDETGLLTDAFNKMLGRIEEQTEALRRDEEIRSFLAAIVTSSDDAIAGKDLTGKVVSWNAGAEQMFGYTAAEMLGQPITRGPAGRGSAHSGNWSHSPTRWPTTCRRRCGT